MDGVTHTFTRARAATRALLLGAVVLLGLVLAPPAHALSVGSLSVSLGNTTAGERSNVTVSANMSSGDPDVMTYDLPAGVMADLDNAPTCADTASAFQALTSNPNACPAASRIGTISAGTVASLAALSIIDLNVGASGDIYRLPATSSDEVMKLGIVLRPASASVLFITINTAPMLLRGSVTLRDASGGAQNQAALRARIPNMPNSGSSNMGTVVFTVNQVTMTMFGQLSNGKRFMSNPTRCEIQSMSLSVVPKSGGTGSRNADLAAPTGCGGLTNAPTTAISAATPDQDKGTAMTVDVNYDDPLNRAANSGNGGRVKAHAKQVAVELPEGVEFNPAGAAAITQCTDAQFAFTSSAADTCPKTTGNTSVIGTASITSPIIGTLSGNVYFGQPDGGSPLVRLFVMVSQGGLRIKLVGDVAVDATTGQITATFDDLPQTPFTNFRMTFNGGNTAMLRTPRSCSATAHEMATTVTPYGGSNATPASKLAITGDCHPISRFAPTVTQTPSVSTAGAATNLTLTMTRPQGDARFTSANVALPAGLVGKLASVTPCSTANANAGTCPSSSQIGTVETQSGDSTASQATLNGQLYVTEAPSGAIAGLSMKVPAVVGPVNLGNVIVPMKIQLRPSDYGLNIVADSIPQRIDGVPLLLRQIKLTIDRTAGNTAVPFMINSSSCAAKSITATLASDQSSSATPSATYTPSGCTQIGFTPSVSVNPAASLSPAVNATADTASAMSLGVTIPSGHSAVKDLTLNLPQGVELNPYSATSLQYCSAGQFNVGSTAPDTCPTASRIATVSIATPSVGTLTGYAYFGAPANSSQVLRMFVMAQAGSGADAIRIKFAGDVDLAATTGRLTARFTSLPTIQFTQMTMSFTGGSGAVLRTPHTCGASSLTTTIAAHAGMANKTPSTALNVAGSNCNPGRFTPTISTSVSSQAAAASTNLTTSITRPNGDARLAKVKVVMPPGLLGNLTIADQCPLATAAAGACGASSEVGTVSTETGDSGATVPLAGKAYLTAPPTGAVAGLALVVNAQVGPVDLGKAVVQLKIVMRPDDAGLTIEGDVPVYLKGVPLLLRQITMQINKAGFLTNRSLCDATSISTTLTSDQSSTASASTPYQATGCSSLSFTPTLSVTASPAASDTAAAMSLAVNLPASGQAQVKDVTVRLPEGVEINPGAGDGLAGCSPAQFAADSSLPAGCPASSQIGTATVNSPLIGVLTGSVFFGERNPAVPNQLMRMFVVAQQGAGDGVRIKLVGDVDVNPSTGQITTTFSNLPQTPFSQFKLDLAGGERAVLSTPRSCGTFAANSSLTPYGGGGGVAPSANLSVGAGCHDPGRFQPSVALDNSPTQAAADTTLTTVISRPDGDARLSRVAVSLPDGLLGRLDAVPRCALGSARAGDCPPASRVGSATTVSGSGASTIALPGDVYFTEGYDGAIAGLAVVVAAKAGPIDLGRAVVMMKVSVRGNASGIDIASDQLPTRLQGVPLTLQSIALRIDRGGFLFNGSSCGTAGASAAFSSDLGATATASSALATTGCANVPFTPSMAIDLTGGVKKDSKPAVKAKLTVPAGHANVRKVTLTMPAGIGADIAALSSMCSREAYDANACPAGAVVGSATATSPAIAGALSGPVTLIKKAGSALPDLGLRLRGAVNVDVVGSVSLGAGNRLVTTFDGIPDVPLTTFELGLNGGAKGVLVASDDICDAPTITSVIGAHTGASKTLQSTPPSAGCSGSSTTNDSKASQPSATVRLAALKGGKPTLKVTAKGGASALRSVVVTLPKGLSVVRKSAPKKTTLQAQNPKGKRLKLAPKTVAWKAQTFTLKLPSTGARTTTLTLRKGALKAAGKTRKSKKLKIRVKLTPVKGKARTQQLTVRVAKK
ncbi:MAG: hypothetical protein JHC84_15865 [Solirubrobacteraceae bacterium]|nr:hypothetical protein [Solirubrobacteraceae bacterium]